MFSMYTITFTTYLLKCTLKTVLYTMFTITLFVSREIFEWPEESGLVFLLPPLSCLLSDPSPSGHIVSGTLFCSFLFFLFLKLYRCRIKKKYLKDFINTHLKNS